MTPPPPPPPPPPPAPPPSGNAARQPAAYARLVRPRGSVFADRSYQVLAALASIVAVVAIGYLLWKTIEQTGPTWSTFGVLGFVFGTEWVPTPAVGDAVFGALPFIYGTLMTSAIALVIAVPISIGLALATSVFLPRRLRGPVGGFVNLLEAFPSVLFGLWGLTVLVPFLRPALDWLAATLGGISIFGWNPFGGPATASSFLIASLVLAIMVIPIVTAITREVLLAVPREQQEAAYALGATRWEMVKHSMLPWARSGIVGASALGLGRAVGETIAIAMLLGNSPVIFGSLLGPGATLAGVIALETNEADGLQLSSLTALAVVLFVIAFVINAAARLLVVRSESGPSKRGLFRWRRRSDEPAAGGTADAPLPGADEPVPVPVRSEPLPITGRGALSTSRRVRSGLAEGFVWLSVVLGGLPLVLLAWEMLYRGLPALFNLSFFTSLPPLDPSSYSGGIANALVGTLILMAIALVISAPLGVLTALFMQDISKPTGWQGRIARALGFFVDVLLGIPSIVVGLVVYLGIVVVQQQFSALAGGIALAIIMFPIVVRTADEMLRLVPKGQKEAAQALGAPRWRVTLSIVLPSAGPGILTGILFGLARVSGETAPLLFTSLGNQFMSTNIMEPIAAIPQLIYQNTVQVQTPASMQLAWGAALVLVLIIMFLNVAAWLISRKSRTSEGR